MGDRTATDRPGWPSFLMTRDHRCRRFDVFVVPLGTARAKDRCFSCHRGPLLNVPTGTSSCFANCHKPATTRSSSRANPPRRNSSSITARSKSVNEIAIHVSDRRDGSGSGGLDVSASHTSRVGDACSSSIGLEFFSGRGRVVFFRIVPTDPFVRSPRSPSGARDRTSGNNTVPRSSRASHSSPTKYPKRSSPRATRTRSGDNATGHQSPSTASARRSNA